MPLQIIQQDITRVRCDAIVNAANSSLLGGGGVDGAIHKAAGPGLLRECLGLGGCKTGQAKLTKGYNLPAKYVIHTVGPVWRGGGHGEKELLESCYREALRIAAEQGCESVAFPLISSGIYGYPKEKALRVAVDTIAQCLREREMQVYLVVLSRAAVRLEKNLAEALDAYLDERCLPEPRRLDKEKLQRHHQRQAILPSCADMVCENCAPEEDPLAAAVRELDESFTQMLLRKIDELGMTDAQCYKKANVDRKLFSKIRGDIHYRPSKPTVIAFAIALELSLEETKELLMKAGYALSHSNRFDLIIEFFIQKGNYNIYEINEALFAYDQTLLGA